MEIVEPIIIIGIVAMQIFFFWKNLQRMKEFRDIFCKKDSWSISRDTENRFVNGIKGDGNNTFKAIKESINKYLRSHAGSVVDFSLLKDAVDRHCDSVEEDINTQTPVPLYCGLAGTMIGVIIGLSSLIYTDSITALLGGGDANAQISQAAHGVNDLLTSVAWAMFASILGISLTTANSLLFKKYKLEEESGKNDFLAWMQSELLPELPSDTSDVMKNMVKNLNSFNHTFSANTKELGKTLSEVNRSYQTQAEIIGYIQNMDIEQVAEANITVLRELKGCTDELHKFQVYLNSVQGYTTAIQKFTELFNGQSERLHILEDIRDFFQRYKAALSKDITDADDQFKKTLSDIRNSTTKSIEKLNTSLTREADSFIETNRQMLAQFTEQINGMPKLYQHLESISQIPSELKHFAQAVTKSNEQTLAQVNSKLDTFLSEFSAHTDGVTIHTRAKGIKGWMTGRKFFLLVIATEILMGVALFWIINYLYQ